MLKMNLLRNPGSQYLCCDIVARLSNDVQCLICELEHLRKLGAMYRLLQDRFNCLADEMEAKLRSIARFKEVDMQRPTMTVHKAEEFATFTRLVWNSLHSRLEKKSLKFAYYSIVDGSPLSTTLRQIMNFMAEIAVKYQPYFVHGECSLEFTEMSDQMNHILHPELTAAISLQPALAYTWDMMPCLVNMSTIVDMYTTSPRYDTIASLCQEIIDGVTTTEENAGKSDVAVKAIAWLLKGGGGEEVESTVPCVEHITSRMPNFVHEMTQYLLDVSLSEKRPVPPIDSRLQICRVQYRCINNPYMYLQQIHPAVLNCYQPVYVAYHPGGGGLVPTSQLRMHYQTPIATSRVRRRVQDIDDPIETRITIKRHMPGRGPEVSNDLPPIKLPRLSDSLIKPFDY